MSEAGPASVVDAPPDHDAAPAPGGPIPLLTGERFWSQAFPVLTVLLAVSVPALLIAGRAVMLNSTAGSLEQQVTDPAAPGWQAFTEPTPTAFVLHHDASRRLVGVTLLSLTGADAGALVLVPVDTLIGDRALADVAGDGEPALRSAVEQLLGVAPTDVVSVDASAWRDLAGPVAPLTVENPDDVYATTGDGRPALRFPKGPLQLTAADVDDYLTMRNPSETDLNRLVRHDVLWRAWLQAVGRAASRDEAVPGEAGTGLARYVRALAGGRLDVSTLPVRTTRDQSYWARYQVQEDQARALLTRVVPFPVSSTHQRLRIRLLDGTGTLQHGMDAAAALVGGGGQIDQIGNATSFDVPTTKLEFADDGRRAAVEALAAALGTGELVKTTSMDGATDVVVTLGRDYRDRRAAGGGGHGG